jgi:hypothetical protein
MDINDFKKKLNDGGYPTISSARKAIGRVSDWSKKLREEAHDIADKHFSGTPAKKAVPVKKAPAEPVTKKAAAAPKKTAAKKAASKRAAPREEEVDTTSSTSPEPKKEVHADYSHIRGAIETLKETLNLSQINKTLGPDAANVAATAERANAVLAQCVDEVQAVLNQFSVKPRSQKDPTIEAFGRAVAASQPGIPAPSQDGASNSSHPSFPFPETLFREPLQG